MTLSDRIDAILAKCRRVIELSDAATPGRWEHKKETIDGRGGDEVANYVTHGLGLNVCLNADGPDAAFIAESRTLTPQMAKAVIAAIQGFRSYGGNSVLALEALTAIADAFEEGGE